MSFDNPAPDGDDPITGPDGTPKENPVGIPLTEESSLSQRRPPNVDDATVKALGKLSEAFEIVEHARGLLYGFHRLTGSADIALGEAVELLWAADHPQLAEKIQTDLVGRNVLAGRWTFQVVEEYDDGYYSTFRQIEQLARDRLVAGRRHLFEAEMKESRRTHGREGHEASPERAD